MKSIPRNSEFDEAFRSFVARVQELVKSVHRNDRVVTWTEGRRYMKIISSDADTKAKMVWGFVDKTNGAIYRAASWGWPSTKHIRGYITDSAGGMGAATPYGVRYLRGGIG